MCSDAVSLKLEVDRIEKQQKKKSKDKEQNIQIDMEEFERKKEQLTAINYFLSHSLPILVRTIMRHKYVKNKKQSRTKKNKESI